MKRNLIKNLLSALTVFAGLMLGSATAYADEYEFRLEEEGKVYWYENGVRQGTYDDVLGILGDGTNRGREIYDPATNAWYWLDSCYNGAKAVNKEVWIPYVYQDELVMSADGYGRIAGGITDSEVIDRLADQSTFPATKLHNFSWDSISSQSGKWVRYDSEGHMIKGWLTIEGSYAELYPDQAGNTYYYDTITGAMVRNCTVAIDGYLYSFDLHGVLCPEPKYSESLAADGYMSVEEMLGWGEGMPAGDSFVAHDGNTLLKNGDGSVTYITRYVPMGVNVPTTFRTTFTEAFLNCDHVNRQTESHTETVYDSLTYVDGGVITWEIGYVYIETGVCEDCGYSHYGESDLVAYDWSEHNKSTAISTYQGEHFRHYVGPDGTVEIEAKGTFCDRMGNWTYYLSDGTTQYAPANYVDPDGDVFYESSYSAIVLKDGTVLDVVGYEVNAYGLKVYTAVDGSVHYGPASYETPDGLSPVGGRRDRLGWYEDYYTRSTTYYALDGSLHYDHLVDGQFIDEEVEEFPEEVPEEFKAMNGCWNETIVDVSHTISTFQ